MICPQSIDDWIECREELDDEKIYRYITNTMIRFGVFGIFKLSVWK